MSGSSPRPPGAMTESGGVRGEWQGSVAVFRGIPFAASPAGPARWRPPARPAAWDGVRPATEFGPAPVQPQPRRNSIMFLANFADRRALVMSEDCLYLNVWTPDPAPSARLPVLVWLHGGGYRFGYGSQDIHDGQGFARRGLVVVTLNYRLGALGFLAHPELSREDPAGGSGNWALLDVIAALRWVQANIGSFGGDPARVTAAGNSAGAAFVCHLMASPLASGLFSRAIGQSSAGLDRADGPMRTLAQAEAAGVELARSVGAGDLPALRALSAAELAVAGPLPPNVDGRVFTQDTQSVFGHGRQAPVPLLVGSNTDEGSIYTPPGAAAELAAMAAGFAVGSAFHAAYPTGDAAAAHRSARLFTGETRFAWPVWRWATRHARTGSAPVWVYRFGREPPLPPDLDVAPPPDGCPGYGSFHSAELPYVWDNLRQLAWPWTAADHALAETMSSAWVRFAATGDPNGGDLPNWPRFGARRGADVMHFAASAQAGGMDRAVAMRALDELSQPGG